MRQFNLLSPYQPAAVSIDERGFGKLFVRVIVAVGSGFLGAFLLSRLLEWL